MIICIYGEYGVGKDTFADMLIKAYQQYFNYDDITVKKILSYTTRKPRENEKNTHEFISKKEWNNLNNFLAQTKINGEYYGATIDQFDADYNIYVVNEEGAGSLILAKNDEELSKKMGKLFIIKITRPKNQRNIDKNRIEREKVYGKISKKFLEENTHFEVNNIHDLTFLQEIADSIPILLPYFKLIE